MKIIIIGPAHPFRGGIAHTNGSLARAFQRDGHEVDLVTFTVQYPSFLFPGKTQYSSDPPPASLSISRQIHAWNPFNWWSVARKISGQKADLVIMRYWIPVLGFCLGSIARFLRKKTKIISICDNIIPHESRLGDRWLTQYFVNANDGFVTMSKTVEKELKNFTEAPQIYLPHPINDDLGQGIDKIQARQKLGLDPDGKYVLFFGLVRKYKGLDLLLKGMVETIVDPSVNLLIVGEFYEDPKIYTDLIEQLGLTQRVIIINKFVPTADIRFYFSASDLVAQTYHTASQSGVTQIAYHFDTPMLVTNVGGLSEIIPDGVVGYVVERSPTDIAEAISDFYKNDRYAYFSKNVSIEKQKYSWDEFVEKLIRFSLDLSN